MKIVGIDGDGLVYRVGFAADNDPVEFALHSVKLVINDIVEACEAEDFEVVLSGKTNFRNDVAVTYEYKGNRKDARKPVHYDAIREYLINVYGAVVTEGIEADDYLATALYNNQDNYILCTQDKDLNMVPGMHYNWVTKELFGITPEEGMYHFFTQLLTGDTVDNIKGLNKIGPKKAAAILEDSKNYMCTVGLWYAIKEDDPEQRMLENAKLLWMRVKDEESWDSIQDLQSYISTL